MTEPVTSTTDISLKNSIPMGMASLESILCTEELRQRTGRPPDYEKENRAIVALSRALVESPLTILQTLADTILEVTNADSSGLSLLTTHDEGKRFYWPAIAGMWKPHTGGGTPRDFGPCGDVLDQNKTLLFRHFERRYPYLQAVIPQAEECLLVPFSVGGKAVGTIWAIMHDNRRKFDAEDDRLMTTLGQFASLAYQTVEQHRRELIHLGRVVMVAEMSGALAHELGQPLTAIQIYAESSLRAIRNERPDLAEVRDDLEAITLAEKHATGIIDRARAHLRPKEPHQEELDVNEIVRETLALVSLTFHTHAVTTTTHLASDLPPVLGDRIELQQVAMNIILNACDAMSGVPEGRRRLDIITSHEDDRI